LVTRNVEDYQDIPGLQLYSLAALHRLKPLRS